MHPENEHPGVAMTSPPTYPTARPWLLCAVSTFVAIPAWFGGLLALLHAVKAIDRPVGIPFYLLMCLVASAFVVPLNALAIAPALARLAFPSHVRALVIHLITITASVILLWCGPSMIAQVSSLNVSIIPLYIAIFLLPPVLIGSIIYSLQYNSLNRRR